MNYLALRHLAWKEYRNFLPIVLTMGAMVTGLLIINGTGTANIFGNRVFNSSAWIWTACSILCSLVGLIIGVSTFSLEQETGTDNFLLNLPIPTLSLAAGKLVPGLAATILFSSIVLLALFIFSWNEAIYFFDLEYKSAISKFSFVATLIVLPAVELFVWGALFAMITNRTLVSVILAALANSISIYCTRVTEVNGVVASQDMHSIFANAYSSRMLVVAVVIIVDCYLAYRWSIHPGRSAAPMQRIVFPARVKNGPSNRPKYPIYKLAWQGLRQSKLSFVATMIAIVTTSIFMMVSLDPTSVGDQHTVVLSIVPALFALMGLCVYLPDQYKSSYLFFQQHAEFGRWIWASRTLIWMCLFCLGFLAFTICSYIGSGSFYMDVVDRRYVNPYHHDDSLLMIRNFVPLFSICFCCFAIGQLFSMFFRSVVLGSTFGLISSYIFLAWGLFVFDLHVGFWWTILPVGLSMFVATWWHAPHWLSGTRSTRSAIIGATPIVLTFTLSIAGILFYRAYEIPKIAEPLLLPAEIKNLTPNDFPSIWPNKYPELAEKWDADPRQQSVFEDDLDQANQDRGTVLDACNKSSLQGWVEPDDSGTKIAALRITDLSEKRLKEFIDVNQEPIDALMSIKDPYGLMPTLITSKQEDVRPKIRDLLFANAEFHLRNGDLIESYDSIAQFVGLVQTVHFQDHGKEIASVRWLWEKWMEHSAQTASTLRYGKLPLPDFTGPAANLAIFELRKQSIDNLAFQTRLKPWLRIPSEIERYRRHNEYHIMSNTRDNMITGRMLVKAGQLSALFSRNDFYNPISIGSNPEKWTDRTDLPNYNHRPVAIHFPLLRAKHKLLTYKAEQGRYPSVESFSTVFEYHPNGMDGDVYTWDGFELKLLVKKDQPFLLSFANQWQRNMNMSHMFERWIGKPQPENGPKYQIELMDGTIYRSETEPTRYFAGYGSRIPSNAPHFSIRPYGTHTFVTTPIGSIKQVRPMREVGEGATNYLLNYNPDLLELLLLEK